MYSKEKEAFFKIRKNLAHPFSPVKKIPLPLCSVSSYGSESVALSFKFYTFRI